MRKNEANLIKERIRALYLDDKMKPIICKIIDDFTEEMELKYALRLIYEDAKAYYDSSGVFDEDTDEALAIVDKHLEKLYHVPKGD